MTDSSSDPFLFVRFAFAILIKIRESTFSPTNSFRERFYRFSASSAISSNVRLEKNLENDSTGVVSETGGLLPSIGCWSRVAWGRNYKKIPKNLIVDYRLGRFHDSLESCALINGRRSRFSTR